MRHSSLVYALPLLTLAWPGLAESGEPLVLAKLVAPKAAPAPSRAPVATPPPIRVRMEVAGVLPSDGGPVAILRDASRKRVLPIWIGEAEARAIRLALDEQVFPRPLTHDLLATTIARLGATLTSVEVSDLRANTFIGTAYLQTADGRTVTLDARPSDLLALALRARAPIFVRRHVLMAAQLEVAPEVGPRVKL